MFFSAHKDKTISAKQNLRNLTILVEGLVLGLECPFVLLLKLNSFLRPHRAECRLNRRLFCLMHLEFPTSKMKIIDHSIQASDATYF